MKDTFLLVDGNSLMHRAFHALPLMDADGVYTNAVYGFLSMLLKVIREENVQYAAVCFDEHGPTFRHTVYAEYKAGRAATPPELRQQFETIHSLLDDMGIRRYSLQGWEADDLLGTLSLKGADAGAAPLVLTGDRDALQLVGGGTELMFTRKGISETIRFTPEKVYEEYGFTPAQVTDWKGLAGDSSDNIPGVPGVGDAPDGGQYAAGLMPEAHALAIRVKQTAGQQDVPLTVGDAARHGVAFAGRHVLERDRLSLDELFTHVGQTQHVALRDLVVVRRIEGIINDICGRLLPGPDLFNETEVPGIDLFGIIHGRQYSVAQADRFSVNGQGPVIVNGAVLPQAAVNIDPVPPVADHLFKTVLFGTGNRLVKGPAGRQGNKMAGFLQLPDRFPGGRNDQAGRPVRQRSVNIKEKVFFILLFIHYKILSV